MIWQDLETPVVRDLAWACFSQPMLHSVDLANQAGHLQAVHNCQLPLNRQRIDLLQQLDRDPASLQAHLASRKSHRLGIYFENLWQFFLHHDAQTELVAHNLPVRDQGRTLGEFDCIYFCKRQRRFFHLELAVKFYLGVPGQATWLGPGCEDQLALKVSHLVNQQILLAEQPPAQSLLSHLGIDELHRQIEIKGYLFAPADHSTALPPGHNPSNTMQSWYTLEQFQALYPGAEHQQQWQHIPRERWLAPVAGAAAPRVEGEPTLPEALQLHFAQNRQPQLYAHCDAAGKELQRCFVTPNDWPDQLGRRSARRLLAQQ